MKQNLLRTALVTGATAALSICLFLILLYAFGLNPFGQYKMMFMPLYAVVLMGGLWFFRQKYMGGWMHGWQGVFLGVLTAVFAAAIYAVLVYTLLGYLMPDMLTAHKANLTQWMQTNQAVMIEQFGQQVFDDNLRAVGQITAADIALDEWIKTAAVGLVIGMAMGLFFKKTPPAKA
ncbi:DUF4199 domain-containing protein [Rhodoflexus sp.]